MLSILGILRAEVQIEKDPHLSLAAWKRSTTTYDFRV